HSAGAPSHGESAHHAQSGKRQSLLWILLFSCSALYISFWGGALFGPLELVSFSGFSGARLRRGFRSLSCRCMLTGMAEQEFAPGPVFATTRWSLVLNAARPDSPESDHALAELCRLYWYPLYAHVRRFGHDPHTAQDLTQEFFARLLE